MRFGSSPGSGAALCQRDAVEQPVEVGLLGVLVLDDDRDVAQGSLEMRRQAVERLADDVVESHVNAP